MNFQLYFILDPFRVSEYLKVIWKDPEKEKEEDEDVYLSPNPSPHRDERRSSSDRSFFSNEAKSWL